MTRLVGRSQHGRSGTIWSSCLSRSPTKLQIVGGSIGLSFEDCAVNSIPSGQRRPVYRSRAVLAAPVLLYLVFESWLAFGIDGRGCPQVITSVDLAPVVISLGVGVLGAGALLAAGAIRRRGDLVVLAASLGIAVVVGLLAFIGTQSAFYCM